MARASIVVCVSFDEDLSGHNESLGLLAAFGQASFGYQFVESFLGHHVAVAFRQVRHNWPDVAIALISVQR